MSSEVLEIEVPAQEWWARARLEAEILARGERAHYGLTYPDFCQAYEAVAYANCRGAVMDTRLDISWSTVGIIGEEAVAAAQARFIAAIDAWLRDRKATLLLLWVLEDGPTFGVHSHMMLDVPDQLAEDFARYCRAALEGIAPCQLRDDEAVRTFLPQPGNGDVWSQWARFRYMMKGVSPYALLPGRDGDAGFVLLAEFAELERSYEGDIRGQRLGWSDALSPAARALWQAHLPDMTVRVDGPQLYGNRFLDYCRQGLGLEHFRGELAARNAEHLSISEGE